MWWNQEPKVTYFAYHFSSLSGTRLWNFQFREERINIAEDHEESGSESEEDETVEKQPVFEVEASALHCTSAVDNYQQITAAKWATHTTVVKTTIHFWRSGATCGEILGHTDYGRHGKILTNHLCWTNAMNNIMPVTPEEWLFCPELGSSGKKVMLWLEQKPVNWMMDAVSKFCKAGEVIVDTCTGMLATAKACLKLPQHRRFIGCEKDSMWFVGPLWSVLEVFARQFLNPESDLDGKEEVLEFCKVFIKAMEAIL